MMERDELLSHPCPRPMTIPHQAIEGEKEAQRDWAAFTSFNVCRVLDEKLTFLTTILILPLFLSRI